MKRKHYIIAAIVVAAIAANTRLVIQPDYNHYVIGSRLGDISICADSKRINAIWIGDRLFTVNDEIYKNL
ncbi:MAG: hypothetical protein LBR26_15970 [Prevotella sp.]|jgi:hypothetical protein|nr:hypothetical protein [Prevotella sp.]